MYVLGSPCARGAVTSAPCNRTTRATACWGTAREQPAPAASAIRACLRSATLARRAAGCAVGLVPQSARRIANYDLDLVRVDLRADGMRKLRSDARWAVSRRRQQRCFVAPSCSLLPSALLRSRISDDCVVGAGPPSPVHVGHWLSADRSLSGRQRLLCKRAEAVDSR